MTHWSLGTRAAARQPREIIRAGDGTALALQAHMLRTIVLALACVLVAAPPVMAKKRHGHAHAAKKAKRPKRLVRMHTAAPTRVAAVEQHPARSEVATPAPVAASAPASPSVAAPEPVAAPSPPVAHGPMGPQDSDDEVPGSRMKR